MFLVLRKQDSKTKKEISIVWDGKGMRTLSHTRVGFKTFPAEAVPCCCLNLAIYAENGFHRGLEAGYSLAPSMLERSG